MLLEKILKNHFLHYNIIPDSTELTKFESGFVWLTFPIMILFDLIIYHPLIHIKKLSIFSRVLHSRIPRKIGIH